MRAVAILAALAFLVLVGLVGFRLWQFAQLTPKTSSEISELNKTKRVMLRSLRDEKKFLANNYPPLGYTGAETDGEKATAISAVDGVIDAVLKRPDGPLPAKLVSKYISTAMHRVQLLATEDRDRTQGYMLEIWYFLGFKGATGLFAYGSDFRKPPGYGEPLPPGWVSPTQPRKP